MFLCRGIYDVSSIPKAHSHPRAFAPALASVGKLSPRSHGHIPLPNSSVPTPALPGTPQHPTCHAVHLPGLWSICPSPHPCYSERSGEQGLPIAESPEPRTLLATEQPRGGRWLMCIGDGWHLPQVVVEGARLSGAVSGRQSQVAGRLLLQRSARKGRRGCWMPPEDTPTDPHRPVLQHRPAGADCVPLPLGHRA